MPEVRVEFLGLARARAGVASAEVPAATVPELISALSTRFPDLADECFSSRTGLRSGWLLCLDGRRFTRDCSATLEGVDSVLLMPADAGG